MRGWLRFVLGIATGVWGIATSFAAGGPPDDLDAFLARPSIRQMRVVQAARDANAHAAVERLSKIDVAEEANQRDSLLRLAVALGGDLSPVDRWPEEIRHAPTVRLLVQLASALRAPDDREVARGFLRHLSEDGAHNALFQENMALFGEQAERLFDLIVGLAADLTVQASGEGDALILAAHIFKRDFGRVAEESIQDAIAALIRAAAAQTDVEKRQQLFDMAHRLLEVDPSRTREQLLLAVEQIDWSWERSHAYPSWAIFAAIELEPRSFSWEDWRPILGPFLVDPREADSTIEASWAWECNRQRLIHLGDGAGRAYRAGRQHHRWVESLYREHWKSLLMNDVPEAVVTHLRTVRDSNFRKSLLLDMLATDQIDVVVAALNFIPEISIRDDWRKGELSSDRSLRDPDLSEAVRRLFHRAHDPHASPRLPEALRLASSRAMARVEPDYVGDTALIFLPFLSSEDASIRRDAVWALQDLERLPPWSVETLARLLGDDPDAQVRVAVVSVLEQAWERDPALWIQSQPLGFALLANAAHPDTEISVPVQRLLLSYVQTSPHAKSLIDKGLNDANPEVRKQCEKFLRDRVAGIRNDYRKTLDEDVRLRPFDAANLSNILGIGEYDLHSVCSCIFHWFPDDISEDQQANQVQLFVRAGEEFEWSIRRITELKGRVKNPEHRQLLEECLQRITQAAEGK